MIKKIFDNNIQKYIIKHKDSIVSMTRKRTINGRYTLVSLKNGDYFITGYKIHEINKMIGAYNG